MGDPLSIPLNLDLSEFLSHSHSLADTTSRSCAYELNSVVVHEGSLNLGHYICLAKTQHERDCTAMHCEIEGICDMRGKGSQWYMLNDHIVSKISEQEVLDMARGEKFQSADSCATSTNAYMVFYTKKKN